jgi:hypothetical protein
MVVITLPIEKLYGTARQGKGFLAGQTEHAAQRRQFPGEAIRQLVDVGGIAAAALPLTHQQSAFGVAKVVSRAAGEDTFRRAVG